MLFLVHLKYQPILKSLILALLFLLVVVKFSVGILRAECLYNMDQEDNKMDTVNPHEMSSNPLSLEKDEIMGTENPLSSGKDDVMGTKNPPEVSSNSLSSAKDGMVDTANPTKVLSNPTLSVKDNMMGTEIHPSSGKNGEMCAENPPEVSSNSPSSGRDSLMGTENPTKVFFNPLSRPSRLAELLRSLMQPP